jgi:hypothetical protein
MVALDGQHKDWLVKVFSKEVPPSRRREPIWGIFCAEA